MESKKTSNKLRQKKLNKSISLIIKNNNFSNNSSTKKLYKFIPKTSYSVQTSERKIKPNNGNMTTNNSNYSSQLYNLNFYRQNSQSSLYSLKKENNKFSDNNNLYPRLNMRLLSEIKSPKFIEYINNRRKNKKYYNYSQNFNDRFNDNKMNINSSFYKKSNQNSFTFGNKNKNFSQRNIKLKLEEYYDNSIVKTKKNHKNSSKIKFKDDELYINKKTNGNNRYDKNKCVIERKFYGEDKLYKIQNKNKINDKEKNKEKYTQNKNLSGNGDNEYNKLFYNHSKHYLKKDINNSRYESKNDNNNYTNNNHNEKSREHKNLSINSLINYKWSSSKMLLNKSKTNNNILNTSLEPINKNKINNSRYSNITNDNKESKNSKYDDIKLIFPSFFNKVDNNNNESSQESTNLVGNTFSNKITINNSNIGSRKEKFINSFLDGPEDIHSRFVDLHRQRKLFYENMCNKANENEKNINNSMAKISDFDKNEYSEYFDNFNECVPIIG